MFNPSKSSPAGCCSMLKYSEFLLSYGFFFMGGVLEVTLEISC